jgi:nucleotide-binding universal stress UspA family protein
VSGTIVCGVVESEGGLAAARLASALAARLELRLVLAHVVMHQSERARGERTLAGIAQAIGGAETRLAVGSRVDGLAQLAVEEGADAIVVGSRPRGARGGQLRCALGHELEAATGVPVVIAPPATRARSSRRLTLASAGTAR